MPVALSNPPGRVLMIRPSALGDVCRSTPVLVSLKRAFPGASIDWLVQDSFAEAIAHHPDLGQSIPFPRRQMGRWYAPDGFRALSDLLGRLRTPRYDLVLDCQGLARSGVLCRLTGAPVRVGHSDARELGWLGYTHAVPPVLHGKPAIHAVDRMLSLVEALGIAPAADLRLYPPPADLAVIDAEVRLGGRRFGVLAPTSRWSGKRWPPERFAALAEALLRHGLEGVCVVGSAGEREQCGPLLSLAAREPRVMDLIGSTSVGRLMGVIARSSLVVANDSAALHMAVGLGRPMVALYGPTDVARVGPYGRSGDVIQHVQAGERLDHKDEALGRGLMERISVEEVLAACMARLNA